MKKSFLPLILCLLYLILPSIAQDNKFPVVIAPDLIVESLEYGRYPEGHSPADVSLEKVVFIPQPGVNDLYGDYGYRIKVKTKRPDVLVWHTFDTHPYIPFRKGFGEHIKPINGMIYFAEPMLENFPKGKHWIQVWVENVKLPRLNYIVTHKYGL